MLGSVPTPSPPLSALRRYFEISLYLFLLISVLTLASTGKLDPVSVLVPPAALLVKGYRWWRGRGPELSQRAATWLVAGYFLFFPVDLWFISRSLGVGAANPALYAALLAAIHLMLFGMIVRLYSASTTRDSLFLAMLAFANMLGAAILTVDTTFLVFLLLFLVAGVSTFMSLEMRRSAEGAAVAPLEAGSPGARRLNRALSLISASVAAGALVVGALIFFLIPRFTVGYLGGYNLQPSLISGFSDNVELGQIGEIKKNTAVVMRVRVEGGPAEMQNVRWRGIALSTFDGKRWATASRERRQILAGADGWFALPPPPPALRQNEIPLRYTVLLEPLATDALFLAAQPERVRGPFAPSRNVYLDLDLTGSLFNPAHNFSRLRYEAFSRVPAVPPQRLRVASASYPQAIRDVYLQLPRLDPRIPALAAQITARADSPYDKARSIETYLRTRFGYTLELSGTPRSDPLAFFLFERRAGHCEYFAAAMTVMLRTLGVPARYVNGFLPGEYNEVGEDFIVRASDAHSWVEVYFPEYGWISFDPTPPSDAARKTWLTHLALYWDWFELAWSEWVINYDFVHQISLAQNLQRASREWTERLRITVEHLRRSSVERLKAWQTRLADAPSALPGALGILLALALVVRARVIAGLVGRLWGLHVSSSSQMTPRLATLHYQQMLRLLERRGLGKPPGQTPLEFAAALPVPELCGPVAELTHLYQSARFGAQSADPLQMSQLLGKIRQLLRPQHR
jgi:transglutaminase-like putative cysteine protease